MAALEKEAAALDARFRAIVPIAAFTAKGRLENLKAVLNESLDTGLTINEIKKVLVQLYAYCGFPRSLNALNTFIAVLKERAEAGRRDVGGKEPDPAPEAKSKLERGTEVQTRLIDAPAQGAVYDFAPAIDVFLKEHLFADIFGRNNLDYQSREIATVGALAGLGTVNQLRSHLNVCMNVGLSESQLRGAIAVLALKVGHREAEAATEAFKQVLAGRNAANKR